MQSRNVCKASRFAKRGIFVPFSAPISLERQDSSATSLDEFAVRISDRKTPDQVGGDVVVGRSGLTADGVIDFALFL